MDLGLKDKVAIVTGGASGIGENVVRGLVDAGARVLIADKNIELCNELAEEFKGVSKAAHLDVSQHLMVENVVEEAIKTFGSLDLAVNSAGVSGKRETSINTLDIEQWKRVIDINLNGTFYCLKYQIEAMRKQGGKNCSIVNLGSILSQVAVAGSSGYVSSKHALVGLTKTAALENAKDNIRVNLVCPGYTETPLISEGMSEEFKSTLAGKHAMGRLAQPQEIADLCLFLLSSKTSFVTGSLFTADGGYTIS